MDRKYDVRYWIKTMFVDAIRCTKKNNKYRAKESIDRLIGMIIYMKSVGDITEDTYKKVYNITKIIVHKYDLY